MNLITTATVLEVMTFKEHFPLTHNLTPPRSAVAIPRRALSHGPRHLPGPSLGVFPFLISFQTNMPIYGTRQLSSDHSRPYSVEWIYQAICYRAEGVEKVNSTSPVFGEVGNYNTMHMHLYGVCTSYAVSLNHIRGICMYVSIPPTGTKGPTHTGVHSIYVLSESLFHYREFRFLSLNHTQHMPLHAETATSYGKRN